MNIYYIVFDELFHPSEEGQVEQPVERLSLFSVSIKASEKNIEWQNNVIIC